jgi:hypothetical protein
MPAVELPQLEPAPAIAPGPADHSTHPHPPPLPQEVTPGSLWAAVQQLHVHVKGNKAYILREWACQRNVAGSVAWAKVFKEQALSGSLRVFAFMQPGSFHVHVLCSAAIYCDLFSGDDAIACTIAFVGDHKPAWGCFPVVLKPEKPWTWPTIALEMDSQALQEFYGKDNNRLCWWQPEGIKTGTQVTIMLLIPLALANFLVALPRTGNCTKRYNGW